MAAADVGQKSAQGSGTSLVIGLAGLTVNPGDVLHVDTEVFSNITTVQGTPTDNASPANAYTTRSSAAWSSTFRSIVGHACGVVVNVPTQVTVSGAVGTSDIAGTVHQLTGVDNANPVQTSSANNVASSSTPAHTAIAGAAPGELWIASSTHDGGAITPGAPSGFTLDTTTANYNGSSAEPFGSSHQAFAATQGSTAPQWSNSAAANMSLALTAYRAAAGAAASTASVVPVRIANPRVGPMALRRRFRRVVILPSLAATTPVTVTIDIPIESLQAISATADAPIESAQAVATTSTTPIEALAAIAQTLVTPIEAAGGIATTIAAPVEALQAIAASPATPIEATGGVRQTATAPIESTQGTSTTASLPIESLGAVAQSLVVPIESLQGLASTPALPIEAQGNTPVTTTFVVPIESLGRVAAAAAVPIESLAQLLTSTTLPIESLGRLTPAIAVPIEALTGLQVAPAIPLEALAGLRPLFVLPIEAAAAPDGGDPGHHELSDLAVAVYVLEDEGLAVYVLTDNAIALHQLVDGPLE